MRTRSIPRRLLAAAVSLAVAAGLSGCGSDDGGREPTGAVSFVIGARSNMPAPRLDGAARAALESAVANQSYVSIVVADGNPFLFDARGPLLESGANDVAHEQSRAANLKAVEDAIASARARTPEVDLLAAIDLAARDISSESGAHTVVVVDSGLSTVAPLDFSRPGFLGADRQEVARGLVDDDELPDLAGTTVTFQGLGNTAPPQEELTIAQRTNVVAIWEAVIEAASGAFIPEQKPLTDRPARGLPEVTPVPTRPECIEGVIVLTGADVSFLPDSAEFVDPAAARAVLEPIAAQLVESGATATLTGTTARVEDLDGQIALSLRRARAVLEELVELGVPTESLTAVGLGSEFPGYVQDHDAAGNLLPGPAAANRKVVIDPAEGALPCT